MAAGKSQPPWKTKAEQQHQPRGGVGGKKEKRRRKKETPLPPLLPPGTAVEVLRNGSWVGGGTVTIRNDRTYMVSLEGGMTVLSTRRRVRPATTPMPPAATDGSPESDKATGD